MSASTRRGVLVALFGLRVIGAGPLLRAGLVAAEPSGSLRLPDRPLRLTRVLERAGGEGRAAPIIVRRSWELGFVRQGRGIRVDGHQIEAAVTAPSQLSEIARIEELRDASAVFPQMLTEQGMILTPPSQPGESEALAAALRSAQGLIAREPLTGKARARIGRYLAAIHRASASQLDALPQDLFFPLGVPIERSQTVVLPEGLSGRFTLRYSATSQSDAPWLARAEREVITAVAGRERRALEVWTTSPVVTSS